MDDALPPILPDDPGHLKQLVIEQDRTIAKLEKQKSELEKQRDGKIAELLEQRDRKIAELEKLRQELIKERDQKVAELELEKLRVMQQLALLKKQYYGPRADRVDLGQLLLEFGQDLEARPVNPQDLPPGTEAADSKIVRRVKRGRRRLADLVTKVFYDGAGRNTKQIVSDGGLDTAWTDADDASGDVVFEQTQTQYDDNGNPIFVTTMQRLPVADGPGPVYAGELNSDVARVSYSARFYDAAGRVDHEIDYGTNGGTAMSGRADLPRASFDGDDPYLRVDYAYGADGLLQVQTDERGVRTKTIRDGLGRVRLEIQGYDPVHGDRPWGNYVNRCTGYVYDGGDHVRRKLVFIPNSLENKTTEYVYSSQSGSLFQVRQPGWTAQDSLPYTESFACATTGELLHNSSSMGSVHSYAYDESGRLRAETAEMAENGVLDTTVQRKIYRYDALGRAVLLTTDRANSTNPMQVVDPSTQIKRVYDGFGQLTGEYQDHDGVVDTGTAAVRYEYEMAHDGSRLKRMIYPTTDAEFNAGQGRSLWYGYSGTGEAIGRVSFISDGVSGPQYTLEEYEYMGLGTPVEYNRPLIASGYAWLNLSYAIGTEYDDLDRFGRVIEQTWIQTETNQTQHTQEWSDYRYDASSNLLSRNIFQEGFWSMSELYHSNGASAKDAYDALGNLYDFQRGSLVSGSTRPNATNGTPSARAWGYEAGQSARTTLQADIKNRPVFQGYYEPTNSNKFKSMRDQLQIWSEANDDCHPMRALSVRFDGWGNVTEQKDWTVAWLNGGVYAAILSATRLYRYDALNRRSGEGNWDLFYDQAGNVIEERPSGAMAVQYVWSGVGGNHLVLRDRDTDSNQSTSSDSRLPAGIEERNYVITDVQGNVCAITDWAGNAIERYFYTPEGQMIVTNGTSSTPLAGTAHEWLYTYRSAHRDAEGMYYVNGKVIDYRSGGPITASPLAYWHRQMSYEPGDLGWWDKTVLIVAPIGIAAGVTILTGGAGAGWAAGFAAGMMSYAFASSAENRYISGQTGGQELLPPLRGRRPRCLRAFRIGAGLRRRGACTSVRAGYRKISTSAWAQTTRRIMTSG